MGPVIKFYKLCKHLQVPKGRKIFNQLRSIPKLSTEENTCLLYTKYELFHIMVDCNNIQGLIYDLFLRSFLYSFNIPRVDFVCRSAAVWIYQVGYLLLLNFFFGLNSYFILKNLSQL